MNGVRVHHYGLATDNLERSIETLRSLTRELRGCITVILD